MSKENKILKLCLPIRVKLTKKTNGKVYALNLNFWKNKFAINDLKKRFTILVKEAIAADDGFWSLAFKYPKITYHLYYDSDRITDLMNWVSVVDKFFCDAIVNSFVIRDDSIRFLQAIDIRFKGIDKENGRIEVFVMENDEEIIKIC